VGKLTQLGQMAMLGMLSATLVFAQGKQLQTQRSPAANAEATTDKAPADPQSGGEPYHILNGLPTLLRLHHDTEVGTNNPVDVYALVIEMQVMNDLGEQRRQRDAYLADRDLDELLEATNARRRARGLPERTRDEVQQEFGSSGGARS